MKEEQRSKIDRLSMFCTTHRVAVFWATVLVALVFALGITKMKGEVLLEELVPYDHPFLKIIIDFSDDFGTGGSFAGISIIANEGDIFKASILKKILEIDNEVAGWPETLRILTYSIGSRSAQVAKAKGDGVIRIYPVMWPETPASPEEMAKLRKEIFSDPGMRSIVAPDGRSALIATEFKPQISYEQAFGMLRKLAQDYTDAETTIELVGFPVLMGWVYSLKTQIIVVMVISVVLMILILLIIFQNLVGMAAPAAFGAVSTIMGLGFIGWTGLNFSPLLYVLAFLVGARKTSHAVQVTHRYMEEYDETRDNIKACYRTMRAMIMPNWAGVVTDGAGFFILILIKIALMQQVAIFMTFWIMAVSMCGIFTPIVCSFIPLEKASRRWVEKKKKASLLDRICIGAAQFSIGSGKVAVMLIVVGCLALCLWKASGLKIGDPTPGSSLLYPDHPYNVATVNMNQAFEATSEDLVLYFKGEEKEAVYRPAVFRTFDAFDRHLRESLPDIYKSSDSFIGIMKSLNVLVRDGDVFWHELPYRIDQMDGLVGFARANTNVPIQRLYFDAEMKMSQITVYFSDHTSDNLIRIRKAAYDFFEQYPMKIDEGEFFLAGGRIGMEMATNEEMKRTHAKMEVMVLGAIFVLCSLFFRSAVAGLMFTLPLFLANSIAFAYMAMTNIGLSINTLPVAAVGVGVGVDFSIYIYNRCIEEFPNHDGWTATIMKAVNTSGKAVVFTGLTMVLPILVWFVVSDFKFQAQMGLFLAMILSANVILAITLHPLMIHIIKPRFITKRASNTGKA
jgi:predicted RND superfamily exporter protein